MPNASGNPDGSPRFSGKDALQLNKLQDYASRARAIGGHNVLRRQTTSGVILTTKHRRRKPATVPCELLAKLVRIIQPDPSAAPTSFIVRVRWGRVAGGTPRPLQGVRFWEIPLTQTTYIYASAAYNADTRQWFNPDLTTSTSPMIANTQVTAYSQLAACVLTGGTMVVNAGCGPTFFEPCSLVSPKPKKKSGDGDKGDTGDGGALGDAGGLGDSGGLGNDGGLRTGGLGSGPAGPGLSTGGLGSGPAGPGLNTGGLGGGPAGPGLNTGGLGGGPAGPGLNTGGVSTGAL